MFWLSFLHSFSLSLSLPFFLSFPFPFSPLLSLICLSFLSLSFISCLFLSFVFLFFFLFPFYFFFSFFLSLPSCCAFSLSHSPFSFFIPLSISPTFSFFPFILFPYNLSSFLLPSFLIPFLLSLAVQKTGKNEDHCVKLSFLLECGSCALSASGYAHYFKAGCWSFGSFPLKGIISLKISTKAVGFGE